MVSPPYCAVFASPKNTTQSTPLVEADKGKAICANDTT